jgi:hypothetical protein
LLCPKASLEKGKYFVSEIDYKTALQFGKASLEKEKHGGQNKQTILLTIKCFTPLKIYNRTFLITA